MKQFTFPRLGSAALPMALIAVAVSLAGCATTGAAGITSANVGQFVERARTRSDHENLAAYFQGEAQAAKAKAEECREQRHRLMRTLPGSLYPPASTPLVVGHYDQLIEGYERNARAYDALAETHRQLAGTSTAPDEK